jgi:hypothetical protein
MAIRIAFVGKRANIKTTAAHYLYKHKGFKRMQLDDGVTRLVRNMYTYRLHKRVKWEKRIEMYDALYKLDPSIHIDYLLSKLSITTRDVVVPDVRYINEVEKLIKAGFTIVRINSTSKTVRISGQASALAGTVKLQEYFGHDFDAYPVSYSIIADDKVKLRELLDIIIEKERNKVDISDNNVVVLDKDDSLPDFGVQLSAKS